MSSATGFYPAQPQTYYPAASPPAHVDLRAPLMETASLGFNEAGEAVTWDEHAMKNAIEESHKEDAEYEVLKRAMRDRFYINKLNVRRAEIFLKVQKKNVKALALLREGFLYFGFVVAFFWLVMRIADINASYYQNSSLIGESWLNIDEVGKDSSAFSATDNPSDLFAWIRGRLLTVMDPSLDGNTMFLWYRKQIGAIRIRQILSLPSNCAAVDPTTSSPQPYKCYNDFPYSLENRGTLLNMWEWQDGYTVFDPALELHGLSWTYGTGGFSVDIPAGNLAATSAALDALEHAGWMSEATRAVRVTINLQNPHTNSIIVGQFNVEFPVAGASVPSAAVDTLHASPFKNHLNVILALIIALCCIVYLGREIHQFRSMGAIAYFTEDKWNALDLTNLALIIALLCHVLYFHFWSEANMVPLATSADPKVFYRLDEGVHTMRHVMQIAGVAVVLCFMQMYKFFELHPRLSLFGRTIASALPDLLTFAGIFLISFLGYACMAYLIFGHRMEMFKNLKSSYRTLFENLDGLGDLSDEMSKLAPTLAVVFNISFVVTVSLVLVNIFIAIVGKYYDEAWSEERQSREELSELSVPDWGAKLNRARIDLDPVGGEKFTVLPNQAFRVWRSWDSRRRHIELRTQLRSSQAFHEPEPLLEALSVGNPIASYCMMDILAPDSEVWLCGLVHPGKGGLGRLGMLKVVKVSYGFVDLINMSSKSIEIGGGTFYLELTFWTHFWEWVSVYIWDPKIILRRRIAHIFGDYGLQAPNSQDCVDERTLERAIISISERNKRLEGEVGSKHDRELQIAAPLWMKRRTYHLDEMLEIIGKLQHFAEQHNSMKMAMSLGPLVDGASTIDALYHSVAAEGGTRMAGHIEALKVVSMLYPEQFAGHRQLASTGDMEPVSPAGAATATGGHAGVKSYELLMDAAREFDRRCQEIYLDIVTDDEASKAVSGDGTAYAMLIRRSLRFDEVTDIVRGLASGSGASEVAVKKEAMRFLASFPASCFDTLDLATEKLQIFIPQPYDTKAIVDTEMDPIFALRQMKYRVPVPVSAQRAGAGATAADPYVWHSVPGTQLREVDMITLLDILMHDAWALDNLKKPEGERRPLEHLLQLSEEQRNLNKNQGLQTIRAAVCCGYKIQPPSMDYAPADIVKRAKGWEEYSNHLAYGYIPLEAAIKEEAVHQPLIQELVDLLARNSHEMWAKEKKSQGFAYGIRTSSTLLTHKDLVPYVCLDDTARDSSNYSKVMVEAALSLLLACGWKITPNRKMTGPGFMQKSIMQVYDLVKPLWCGV